MDSREKLAEVYPEVLEAPVWIYTSVHWSDMDVADHVNNIIYLKWSETARVAYFEKINMDTSFRGNQGPILGWQDGKYLFPMRYPDDVLVTASVIEIREDRFIVECRVYSLTHQRLAAISKQHIIPYDYVELRKIPIPEDWLQGIKELQPTFDM